MDDRSTILVAQLSDQPRAAGLLEVDLRNLNASTQVGRRVQLIFTAKLTLLGGDEHMESRPMFDLWADITVSGDRSASPRQLGRLRLEEPVFVVPIVPLGGSYDTGRWTRQVQLHLELGHRQVDEIEELRSGGGIVFAGRLGGVVQMSGGAWLLNAERQLSYEVSQSDWLRLLNQVQYGTYVTVEVALPMPGELLGDLATAANALQEATEALRRGADEEAVADCRDALDAVVRHAGGKPGSLIADHSLTKDQRFTYVSYALQRVVHLAHHPRDKAVTDGHSKVPWDRADAQTVITILAALIRRAAR